eukprot:CAMPEP_0119208790 /NCGR_PEP_ID=MMETSP1327-20130426/906_1 /TAXON_ID=38833 /ORGANISM="Micromonas pusilla, Strain RCC2306" /LENGTH=171 /DNA_ID=CAMNT_0007205407 /DNA_START=102 /DNA_END=618 /DNA_ORIENTATION=-
MYRSRVHASRPPVKVPLQDLARLVRREPLARFGASRDDLQGVEPHGFGQRAALPHNHSVAFLAPEARGDVRGDVGVAFFVALVLLDVMKVIHAHDERAFHLGRFHDAGEDAAADGNVARERALLVHVRALDSLPRGLEPKAHVLVVTGTSLAGRLLLGGRGESVRDGGAGW